MSQTTACPPEQRLMQYASGYWVSQVVSVATRLDLIESLAQGPRTASELAEQHGYCADGVARLLRACASLELMDELEPGRFQLREIAQLLTRDHPRSMRDAVIMMPDPGHWNSWAHLDHSVRTGEPAYQKALGVSNVFDYLQGQPEEHERFNRAMASLTRAFVHAVQEAYDFSRFRCIADIGGGHGQLLSLLLQRAPQARGLLFDAAPVLEGALAPLQALGVAERVELRAGNFFEEVPGGPDLYLLKHILHDWTDPQCVSILNNVAQAMSGDARLLVVEMLMPEPPAAAEASMMDLNMMVMTGGRERTVAQFRALFEQAGLRLQQVIGLQGPFQLLEVCK